MSPVDVDVNNIPDMIEAQLTLSYSRLSNLVRLIIDQGNGHDVDIDKLTARINALTAENAELRNLLTSLKDENSPRKEIQNELDGLRQEVARLSGMCDENFKQSAIVAEENAQRISDLDQRLEMESQKRAVDAEQLNSSIRDLQEVTHAVEEKISFPNSFAVLWETQNDTVDSLTRCNPNDEFHHTTEERVAYLHSLPAFVAIMEELEVLRQIVRQQASDILSARSATVVVPHTGAAHGSTTSAVNHVAAVDRHHVGGKRASQEVVNKRITMPGNRVASLDEQSDRDHQLGYTSNPTNSNENIAQFDNRLQQVENRLSKLFSHASGGEGIEKALLVDVEERLRLLEESMRLAQVSMATRESEGGEGNSLRPTQIQRHSSFKSHLMPQGSTASSGRMPNVESNTPFTKPSDEVALPSLDARSAQRTDDGGPHAPVRQYVQSSNPQGFVMHTDNSGRTSSVLHSLPKAKWTEHNGGDLLSRIKQLEDNTAMLKAKKADRRELVQLENTLQRILQSPSISPSSALMRGMAPHRPMSQGETHVDCDTDNTYRSVETSARSGAPPMRSLFVEGSSHPLRDSSGVATSASLFPIHPR